MISKASLTPYHHQSLDEDIDNSAILRTFLELEKITHTCWHVIFGILGGGGEEGCWWRGVRERQNHDRKGGSDCKRNSTE